MKRDTAARFRIAYVFPGNVDRLGGAESQALGFFRSFDRTRFSLDFCLLTPNATFEHEARRVPGVNVQVLSPVRRHSCHPRVLLGFARLLRTQGYDLVHLYGLQHEILTRGLSRYWGRTRVVSAIRGLESHRGRLASWANRATSPAVDNWISNSEAARRVFAERDWLPAERILVVPNGVDPGEGPLRGSARVRARLNLGLPGEDWLVGCVANHLPVKRLEDALAALALLRAQGAGATGVFVGQETAHTRTLRAAVEQLGLQESVRFLGFREDVPELLRLLDVFILPSAGEGLPASILEAMAAGLPVVASAVGGVPELVREGETGFLFRPGDVEALAARLAELHGQPEHARALGARGRGVVAAHYSLLGLARRLEAIYERIIVARRPLRYGEA
jgi:glycosyltransferase involved in cell wall biosynthesis